MPLGEYTINDIVGVVVAISLTVASILKFFDWGTAIFKKAYNKVTKKEDMEEMVKRHDVLITENTQYHKYMGDGIKEILRIFLMNKHEEYIKQGFIYTDQLKDYEEMYLTYKALGGNGSVTRAYDELLTLPIRNR